MSEYMEKHTTSRLLGAPPGYVGYDEGGQLTEAVRRKPYSVVLFDEIEKAHPEVLDVLLQILDDGRATDGQGRTVNFRNTLIIMTSNLRDKKELKERLKPEFINRIDEIIIFKSLGPDKIKKIIDLQLNLLQKRLEEKKITLQLSDKVKEFFSKIGFDPVYGARPLKRIIQRYVQNPLSLKILDGEIKEGENIKIITAKEINPSTTLRIDGERGRTIKNIDTDKIIARIKHLPEIDEPRPCAQGRGEETAKPKTETSQNIHAESNRNIDNEIIFVKI